MYSIGQRETKNPNRYLKIEYDPAEEICAVYRVIMPTFVLAVEDIVCVCPSRKLFVEFYFHARAEVGTAVHRFCNFPFCEIIAAIEKVKV